MRLGAVFLDRDGTINRDVGYLARPEDFALCDGAGAGLRMMRDMGLPLYVVTNQSGLARGYFDDAALAALHARMATELAAFGVTLAGTYHCPHGPDDACLCRKPLPGLIHAAEAAHGRVPAVMIGDSARDMAAGQAAGHRTIRIAQAPDPQADLTAPDLVSAAHWIARITRGAA